MFSHYLRTPVGRRFNVFNVSHSRFVPDDRGSCGVSPTLVRSSSRTRRLGKSTTNVAAADVSSWFVVIIQLVIDFKRLVCVITWVAGVFPLVMDGSWCNSPNCTQAVPIC